MATAKKKTNRVSAKKKAKSPIKKAGRGVAKKTTKANAKKRMAKVSVRKTKSLLRKKPLAVVKKKAKSTVKEKAAAPVKEKIKKAVTKVTIPPIAFNPEEPHISPPHFEVHAITTEESKKFEPQFHIRQDVTMHRENEKVKEAMAIRKGTRNIFRRTSRRS